MVLARAAATEPKTKVAMTNVYVAKMLIPDDSNKISKLTSTKSERPPKGQFTALIQSGIIESIRLVAVRQPDAT